MNREQIMLRAVADVMKERRLKEEKKTQVPVMAEFTMPPPNLDPVIEAMLHPFMQAMQEGKSDLSQVIGSIERFAAREIPAPQVTVAAPNVEVHPQYAFSPHMDGAVNHVHVNMDPVAKALGHLTDCMEKAMASQTACIERMMDKIMAMMNKAREIEIIKDKDGKITGARRK